MDKNVISCIGCFIGGALISGGITWWLTKKSAEKKYSAIADAEIASVKEKFTVPKVEKKEVDKKEEEAKEFISEQADKALHKQNILNYAKNLKAYTNYSNVEYEKDNKEDSKTYFAVDGDIKIIEPDEYGEDDEYDQVELTFYADGILADENDDVIEHVDDVIGPGNLDHIGEYEDDALHIKNEARKVYYEILVDSRSYKDATKKDPPRNDGEDE